MSAGKKHSQRKHATFSASAAERWLACPGSIALTKLAPPQVESVYAKEGTSAHECLEFIVRRYGNLKKAIREAEKRWPPDMLDYVLQSAEEIFKLRPSPCATLHVEKRVKLSHISKRMYGTLDYCWVEDWGHLIVIDFKYGQGVAVYPVEEDGNPNPQLMFYASGICQEVGYDFETVSLAVIQPRAQTDFGDTTRVADFTIADVRKFEKVLKEGYAAALKPNAPLKCGDHCRWCPAGPICPEASAGTMAQAGIVFDIDAGEIKAAPETKLLPVSKLPQILTACNVLEQWIRAVRDLAHVKALSGEEIAGYKLVEKRSNREWTYDAQQAAIETFGEDVIETVEVFPSPAQLEKKFKKKGKEFTAQYTETQATGYALVPANDKRPAAQLAPVMDVE